MSRGLPTSALPSSPSVALLEIDEATARQKAIDQYNYLFTDKYFQDADGKYQPYLKLTAEYFDKAERKGGIWELHGDSLIGVVMVAKVSADGSLVEITEIGYALE